MEEEIEEIEKWWKKFDYQKNRTSIPLIGGMSADFSDSLP